MSKQHYIGVAKILNAIIEGEQALAERLGAEGRKNEESVAVNRAAAVYGVSHELAKYFKRDNPAFDLDRFMEAVTPNHVLCQQVLNLSEDGDG